MKYSCQYFVSVSYTHLYEKEFPINWCPSCKTGLANEEVVNGKCERCGAEVTKKNLRQWLLRITKYADRLLNDLDKLDWPEKVKNCLLYTSGFSIYGSPIESTTYKFAKCLQKRFGIVPGVTDKSYITNSYHVHVCEEIDAFEKLRFESQFQALSTGGAISYVEVPNMQDNIPVSYTHLDVYKRQ